MSTDVDAMVYLMLANDMLHTLYAGNCVTILKIPDANPRRFGE